MNALTTTAQTPNTAIAKMDEGAIIKVLGDSLYPGAKVESIQMVLSYCRAAGLDPMLKPVHIVPMSVKKPGGGQFETVWRDVIMPGIGHYRTQASRSGQYVGKSKPTYGEDVTKRVGNTEITFPKDCTITVYRMVGGVKCEFTATELWLENYATAGKDKLDPNAMWKKRPYGQLAKVAEAQALRMGFPELLGGSNTAEEMEGKAIEEVGDAGAPAVVQERPRQTKAQLDSFSNVKPAQQAQQGAQGHAARQTGAYDPDAGDGEVLDVDPETGEVLSGGTTEAADYPNIPNDALNDWETSGKWMRGYKWFAMQLPEVFPASRQAFVNRHREMLTAVSAHNKYGPELAGLLNANGVKI